MTRARMKTSERRQMILNTAARVVNKRGWFRTTLQDIASACPVKTSLATLYHYFHNRETLAKELLNLDRLSEETRADIKAAIS